MPIRIYIDQGHNPYGFNAGAEGFGLREQDITYLVGAYLANILNADSRFTAITSRTSPDEILGYDTNSSLRTRAMTMPFPINNLFKKIKYEKVSLFNS